MLDGDVVNQLLFQNRLADPGAAEQTDLAAFRIRTQKIDDLDARFQNLRRVLLLSKGRRLTMNRQFLFRLHFAKAVDRLAQNVEHPSQYTVPNRHFDRRSRIDALHSAHQSVRRRHRDAPHDVIADVLCDFNDHSAFFACDFNRVQDGRKILRPKPDVHDRSDHLYDFSFFTHRPFPRFPRRHWSR